MPSPGLRRLRLLVLLITMSAFTFAWGQTDEPAETEQGGPQQATLADEVRVLWADGERSEIEKVKAFRELTEARWLAFAGFVHIYAGRSYLDMFHWHKQQYAEAMTALDSDADVSGLLALATDKLGSDALVSADAMMLAAMLNWEAAQPTLVELSEPNTAKDALVRPIHVHTLCLIAAAKQSEPMLDNLHPILGLTKDEELRQDILCAISALGEAKAGDWIRQFVEANLTDEYELDMETALLVLSKRMRPEAYQTYMTGLIDSANGEATVKLLTLYRDEPPAHGGEAPPPNGSKWFYKLWDGFHATSQEDDVLMRFGDRFEHLVKD